MTNPLPNELKLTPPVPAATKPQPIMEPSNPCVVEIGNPRRVARMTVQPAPIATARRKYSDPVKASGMSPLPENFFRSAWARKMEAIEPARVVSVAQRIETL